MSLIALVATLVTVSLCAPRFLSDQGNDFLKNFVNQNLLSVLGVIVTITLASAANLHLELNKLADEYQEDFAEARFANRAYAYMLIALFASAVGLVITKPLVCQTAVATALFNSGAIIIVYLNILALADLATAVFAIPPRKDINR